MGMWISMDSMVVSKEDFEKWKNGELCLDNYDFKLITQEEYNIEYAKFIEEYKQDNPDWVNEDKEDFLFEVSCEFADDCGYMTREYWENQESDYPEEDCIVEVDNKIVWVHAIYC